MPATADRFDFSPASIRARRESLGLTREVLALATGRSVSAITSWERGDRTPGPRVRPLIAAALDLAGESDLAAATDRVRGWVDESRKASGVPAVVEDDAVAEEIARVLRGDAA